MNRDPIEEDVHDVDCECQKCIAVAQREADERRRQATLNAQRAEEAAAHRVTINFAGTRVSFDDRDDDADC
jgi:hypothetical protein